MKKKSRIHLVCLTIFFGLVGTQQTIFAQRIEKPELIASGTIAGDTPDQSGKKDKVEDGTPCNQFGGISGIEYTGKDNLYLAIGDRGPKDGAVNWDCRFHHLSIQWKEGKGLTTKIVKTVPLKDDQDRRFVGVASAFEPTKQHSFRLDPEGIRRFDDQNLLISDEYGPHLMVFSPQGKQVRKFQVPAHYLIKNPGLDKEDENPQNDSGRQCNRGFEGVCLSQDKQKIVLVLQSPLIQDCDEKGIEKPVGKHIRMLLIDRKNGETKELVYVLDHPKNVINEIIATDKNQFLLIERDGKKSDQAKFKKIIKIDTSNATDVSGRESLAGDLLESVKPVQKSVFLDLLDEDYGLAGKGFPKKIEGLALGPKTEDGKRTLVVASDNDFKTDQPTWIYVFKF